MTEMRGAPVATAITDVCKEKIAKLKEKGISKEGWEALVNKVLSKLDEYATNKDVELAVQEVIEEDDIL